LEENKIDDKDFDKIKVFSSDDDKLKILGELLSNKTSRDIIKLLIDKEMYANEIARKLKLRRNLVIHHVRKMEAIGLLEITNKKIIRNGEEHRFFKIPRSMLIVPNESTEIRKNGILKKIFKDGIKFVSVGIAGIITWFGTQQKSILMPGEETNYSGDVYVPVLIDEPLSLIQIAVTCAIVGIGLFLTWFSKK
jgi:DNA-binding transcriptional ArsR family regulator